MTDIVQVDARQAQLSGANSKRPLRSKPYRLVGRIYKRARLVERQVVHARHLSDQTHIVASEMEESLRAADLRELDATAQRYVPAVAGK